MIHLFHGEEEFEKSAQIRALRAGVSADPALVDLNVTVLEGRSLTVAEWQHHCDVPPFLGDYRLVVVNDLVTRSGGAKTGATSGGGASLDGGEEAPAKPVIAAIITHFPAVPDSTHVVFNESKSVPAKHPLLKAIAAMGALGEVRAFSAPTLKGGELQAWVERRAAGRGARLEKEVAQDLATFIGPNLRLIDQELEKLAIHAGKRAITKADVRLLTPYAQEANIFDMVDALGQRQTDKAFRLLAQLRNEGAHPLYLLTMIVRQYRILLQVKELLNQRLGKEAIAQRLGLHPFAAGKAVGQAQQYTAQQLAGIYDRLLETDVAIKTGELEANLALDLLVVELARA